jgi:hypothetical protein
VDQRFAARHVAADEVHVDSPTPVRALLHVRHLQAWLAVRERVLEVVLVQRAQHLARARGERLIGLRRQVKRQPAIRKHQQVRDRRARLSTRRPARLTAELRRSL